MLKRTIAKYLFYAVAVTLLAWTGSLTYSFLSMALPGAFFLVPLLGLVVFDAGMIAWLFVFLSHAEGAIQRATAIVLCLFDFLGVGLMVMAEILLDGQQLVDAPDLLATAAIWGIGIWTVVNVFGVILFHLGDPEARKEMTIQAEKDAIFDGALKKLNNRRMEHESALADELSEAMFTQLLSELRADKDRNGTPDVVERGKQTAPKRDAARQTPAEQPFYTSVRGDDAGQTYTTEELREAAEMLARAKQHASYSNGNGEGNGSRP